VQPGTPYPLEFLLGEYFSDDVHRAIGVSIHQNSSFAAVESPFNPLPEVLVVVLHALAVYGATLARVRFLCCYHLDSYQFCLVLNHLLEFQEGQLHEVLRVPLANVDPLLPTLVVPNDDGTRVVLDAIVHEDSGRLVEQVIREAIVHNMRTGGTLPTTEVVATQENKIVFADKTFQSIARIAAETLSGGVKHRLNLIFKRVKIISDIEATIFNFLEKHVPNSYTSKQIAGHIAEPVYKVQSNPPSTLLKVGIIKRRRSGTDASYLYRSNLKQFLEDQFDQYRPHITENNLGMIYQFFVVYFQQRNEFEAI